MTEPRIDAMRCFSHFEELLMFGKGSVGESFDSRNFLVDPSFVGGPKSASLS